MTLLHEWSSSLVKDTQLGIPRPFLVEGTVDRHAGPTWMRAEATVIFEPSGELGLDLTKLEEKPEDADKFARIFLFGVLDVTMIDKSPQISNFVVKFIKLRYDKIESSPLAFRLAGREAGRKLLELLKKDT
jgi:hypothetical protein